MVDITTMAPYLNALIFLLTLPVIYFSWAFSKLDKRLGIGLVVFFTYSSIMRLIILLSCCGIIDASIGKELVPPLYFPFWIGLVIIFYIMAKSLKNMPDATTLLNIKKLDAAYTVANKNAKKAKDAASKAREGVWKNR